MEVHILSKRIRLISQFLLGIIFLFAGINGYFVILGIEPFIATSPQAMALFEFHYLLIFEKALEIICGILLLINRFIPLTLAILTPIIANILLFHLFIDHSLLILAIVLCILLCYLLFCYRKNYISLLEKKPF